MKDPLPLKSDYSYVTPETEDEDVFRLTYSRGVAGPIRQKLMGHIKKAAKEIKNENDLL